MADVLIYGDTEREPAMRHEVPIAIGDPFLYAEVDGRAALMTNNIEHDRMARARPDAQLVDIAELGFHDLLRAGLPEHEVTLTLASRFCAHVGLRKAAVPPGFALAVADFLRGDGLDLTVDHDGFAARRRVKSGAEREGIRRAQRAALAGVEAAAALLRRAEPGPLTDAPRDGASAAPVLMVDGEPLLAERVREALRAACRKHDAEAPPDVIVASVWQGFGHEPGSGPLPAGLPIQVDVWPCDEASACWADMTRTFVVGGEPNERTQAQAALVDEALARVRASTRPGVTGRELHALTCDLFEAAGHRTGRTGPGDDPSEGFQFSLGHGVGLQVHEPPYLGQSGVEALVPGDVVAVEPGLWERDLGGVRFEDLWLVTEDGVEVLTDYPYDLAP